MPESMEDTLVNDIKRLRVLTPSDHDNMDEQIQESVQNGELPCINKTHRNSQPGKKDDRSASQRAHNSTEKYVLKSSDESESSLDDGINYHMLDCRSQSDSDDLKNVWHQQKLNSWRHSSVPVVESDSVNENSHPIRQQRRKRKFKRMAVDPHPSIGNEVVMSSKCVSTKFDAKHSHGPRSSKNLEKVSLDHDDVENIWKKFLENPESFCGKRKRSIREKSADCSGTDKRPNFNPHRMVDNADASASWPTHSYIMECDGVGHNAQWEPSSSGLSSSESECGILTNDEGREADDEQSDCFHESATSSGILVDELLPRNINAFRRRFEYITRYGPRASQLKHNLLESWRKREITSGRRRLMKFKPVFCHSLKEDTSKTEYMQGDILRNGSKKRRKTPSVTPPFQNGITQSSLASECHGNSSGWNMEWKPEAAFVPWSCRGQKYATRPSLPAKKRGLSLSEVRHENSESFLEQNTVSPYLMPHTFVPAHNPGDLSIPFISSKKEVKSPLSDFQAVD